MMLEGKKQILEKIPDSDVKRVVAQFKAEGARVNAVPQPDGLWTVTAEFGVEKSAARKLVP